MPASAALQASGESRAETAVRTRALGTSSARARRGPTASGSISSSSAPCASSSPAVARAMPPAPPVITISRFSNSMAGASPRGRRAVGWKSPPSGVVLSAAGASAGSMLLRHVGAPARRGTHLGRDAPAARSPASRVFTFHQIGAWNSTSLRCELDHAAGCSRDRFGHELLVVGLVVRSSTQVVLVRRRQQRGRVGGRALEGRAGRPRSSPRPCRPWRAGRTAARRRAAA